jgi:fructokinase
MKIVCHGEALIDLVNKGDGHFFPYAGGAVYNLARAISAQHIETYYLNPVSRDSFGDLLRAGFTTSGVRLAIPSATALSTSLAIANIDAEGKAHYSFYRHGVADCSLSVSELIQTTNALGPVNLACTGCLALTPTGIEATVGWLQWCRMQGITTLIDINMRRVAVHDMTEYRAGVMRAIALADITKLSDEDANDLFGSQLTAADCAKRIFENGPSQLVCFTQGRQGAQVVSRNNQIWQGHETAELIIADTVGAGDSFTAGFIASCLASEPTMPAQTAIAGWSLENPHHIEYALKRAIATASLCVQQHGAAAPALEQVELWLNKNSILVKTLH